ncbi:pyruvate formate lyase family protein, partial [Planctomycetota bacterium]
MSATETARAFGPPSERVQRFRDASRARGASPPPSPRIANFMHAFFEVHPKRPCWERYARAMAYAIEHEPICLFDDERLVGMLYQGGDSRPEASAFAERWRPFSHHEHIVRRSTHVDPFVGMAHAPGHVGWRWDRVLELGVDGLMADLHRRLDGARDAKAKRLYKGALILWRAVLRWNDRHVEALEAKAADAAGAERERLDQLIALCRRVPREPARSFHEAVQAFHMQHLVLMLENPYGGNGPGRLDYFLWPYLERDLAAGAISEAEARGLIDELLIRLHERIQNHDGWVEAVMAGGSHPDGSSSLNPLSYMLLESIGALDQTHPSVYTRLSPDDPDDFIDLNVRYLLHGGNRAQIYNEPALLGAIEASGVSRADAAMYMAGGCMEVSVQGMASDMNFARTFNVAKTLELVLHGGVDLLSGERAIAHDRCLSDYADFEDLYAAFDAEIARQYAVMVSALDVASECYAEWRPCFLLSSLVGDCLERGREQHDGGARYHDYGFSILGIASAADSLHAIRRAVYGERLVPAGELLAALRADYEGHEELRLRLARIPRYGAGDPEADAMADRVLQTTCRLATATKNRFGGSLKPMAFNFVWTPGASACLGARADGQRAGDAAVVE